MVDVLTVLYGQVMNYKASDLTSPDRDIFILSKGHCVLGYYSTMNVFGLMTDEVLDTFQKDGSHLIAHPVKNLELGIESSNGSLGQGLSFGLGVALGMRLDKQESRSVYVMMGDGECNEGSVWESAASAAEFEAGNLIAIVDVNGLRNDGENFTYNGSVDLKSVWESFGWHVQEVDGHDHEELSTAFDEAKSKADKPSVILARTVKGRGVSFMEHNNDWHHNRITAKTYGQIVEEWERS
ncbi:transketolase [Neptuniibacter sp. SY11_33]|uniref:transketolase n=1 Tax=Neptuniibacter sp. SY11_33 TaxID=3398215 RepID=UPI0039F5B3EA